MSIGHGEEWRRHDCLHQDELLLIVEASCGRCQMRWGRWRTRSGIRLRLLSTPPFLLFLLLFRRLPLVVGEMAKLAVGAVVATPLREEATALARAVLVQRRAHGGDCRILRVLRTLNLVVGGIALLAGAPRILRVLLGRSRCRLLMLLLRSPGCGAGRRRGRDRPRARRPRRSRRRSVKAAGRRPFWCRWLCGRWRRRPRSPW
mmetsp:Transcript_53231/g.114357  ORF Transcript_53231/g.114357 Transcript_53231/m.114357 type:complete len:203 (-) Transcript_53231:58-666(-)